MSFLFVNILFWLGEFMYRCIFKHYIEMWKTVFYFPILVFTKQLVKALDYAAAGKLIRIKYTPREIFLTLPGRAGK